MDIWSRFDLEKQKDADVQLINARIFTGDEVYWRQLDECTKYCR